MQTGLELFASYVRVSRKGTREDERLKSPQFQRELIARFAMGEGVALRDYKPEIDVSGSKPKRAILDRIIADIEAGELAGIVVAKLDRLSRLAPRDRLELFERIEGAGGVVLSASETLDVSTPEGRFARDVFLGIARMQWEKKRDDFAIAKANAIDDGIAIKTLAPFGYRRPDRRAPLEVVPEEAEVVRELFELRLTGASWETLLELFERRTGRRSSRARMKHVCENRTYLGELHYGRTKETRLSNLEAHPAIVDRELFDAVQRVNGERAGDRSGKGSGRAKSLLAGIVKCGGCGAGLVQSPRSRDRVNVYKCATGSRHCSAAAAITASTLDRFVVERVLEWAGPTADELVELELSLDVEGRRIIAEHKLAEAERRLREWSADLELEERDEVAYRAGVDAREARVELRRAELAAYGEASELEVTRASVREALAGDALPDVADRRALLAIVLEAVIVRSAGGRVVPVADRTELRFAAGGLGTEQAATELLEKAVA